MRTGFSHRIVSNMDYHIRSLSPTLQPLMKELMAQNIGIGHENIGLLEINTGRPSLEYISSSGISDRFKLVLPYAGKCLTWDVIFNSLSPNYPPDFDLNDDVFTNKMNVDCLEEMIPSLLNWDSSDSNALKNVVQELYSLYKKYQFDQLKESCCWLEYLSVIKNGVTSPDDIEVIVNGSGTVHFLIRLCPDMTDYAIPKVGTEADDDYAVYISTSFSSVIGGKMSKPQVAFSTALQDLLNLMFKQDLYKILSPKHEGLSLMEYLKKILSKVEDAMPFSVMKPVAKRKRYIFEWLSNIGSKVLEYDAFEFRHISFLLESEGFSCILQIRLTEDFPSIYPEFKLRSVYSAETEFTLDYVLFSPGWSMKVMVEKAIGDLEQQLIQFKKLPIRI